MADANQKPNNPSLGPVFPTKNGSGNYVGIPLDSDTLAKLQKQLAVGSTPFLKKSPKLDRLGREYFFVEFLPATNGNTTGQSASVDDKV